MRRLFRLAGVLLSLQATATARTARAELVWPDVPARVERNLAASDVTTRRNAARELASLGAARAGPLLLRGLSDPDVEVRILSAAAAARLRSSAALDSVLPWLGDREIRLKIAACELAAKVPSARAVPSLARALGDNEPLVRAACAEALGASASDAAMGPLSGRLDDPTPAVRVQVARALARLGDGRAVVPLVGKVQDSVPEVRQAAIRALGDLGDPRAASAVQLALRDNAAEVKIEALAAASRLRLTEAIPLVEPLAFDKNPAVRGAALVTLGRVATPDSVRALVRTLGTAPEETSASLDRTPVRSALVAAGDVAAAELTRLLARPGPAHVTTAAAWALGELHASQSAPVVVSALRSGSLPPAAALHALAGLGAAREIPVVLEFVADPSPLVRAEARRAASALLDPERPDGRAVEPLAAALRDARLTPAERAEVATLLGRTGAPRAATELAPLTAAKDEGLRLAAIDAVGLLALGPGRESAAIGAALVPLVKDRNPTVRVRAATALAASGDSAARRSLEALLAQGDDVDRFAVLTALGGILERNPDEKAALELLSTLSVAAGPERDALVEAAGRTRLPAVVSALAKLAAEGTPLDRRVVAQVLAAHPTDANARTLLERLMGDPDVDVRAQATYSLRAFGATAILARAATAGDAVVATNAMAAFARAAGGLSPEVVASIACGRLGDARPAVVANALAALSVRKARCASGGAAERALVEGGDDLVRLSAARLLARMPNDADLPMLDRCARTDASPEVAAACSDAASRRPPPPPASVRAVSMTVYVHGRGAKAPSPGAAYLVELPEGVLRAGVADRRGAFFEAASPPGELVLRTVGGF